MKFFKIRFQHKRTDRLIFPSHKNAPKVISKVEQGVSTIEHTHSKKRLEHAKSEIDFSHPWPMTFSGFSRDFFNWHFIFHLASKIRTDTIPVFRGVGHVAIRQSRYCARVCYVIMLYMYIYICFVICEYIIYCVRVKGWKANRQLVRMTFTRLVGTRWISAMSSTFYVRFRGRNHSCILYL